MNNLKESLKPSASFVMQNLSTSAESVLCLFPGHFDTTEIVDDGSGKMAIAYSEPRNISNAGYTCDQVADDYNSTVTNVKASGGKYTVKVSPKSPRTRYHDFLNYVRFSGLRVIKIRITDLLSSSDHEIFNQELEISASAVGAKAGSDIIQLSSHIDPSNYIQRFIDIDLSAQNLLLDETTLAFLKVPAGAKFQIDFTLGK